MKPNANYKTAISVKIPAKGRRASPTKFLAGPEDAARLFECILSAVELFALSAILLSLAFARYIHRATA
jgi:hypothetical protein